MAHFLVVDDETMVRNLLGTVLTRLGHSAAFAATGNKAIGSFQAEQPHVVILDLRLPDLDGIGVLEQVRAADPRVPVIILTGAGSEEDEARARALGVTEFIHKGFSLHELGQSLARALKECNRTTSADHTRGFFRGRPSTQARQRSQDTD